MRLRSPRGGFVDADGEAARKLIAGGFVAVEVETKPRKTTRKRTTARKTKPQE
jgi:hypothetical protein